MGNNCATNCASCLLGELNGQTADLSSNQEEQSIKPITIINKPDKAYVNSENDNTTTVEEVRQRTVEEAKLKIGLKARTEMKIKEKNEPLVNKDLEFFFENKTGKNLIKENKNHPLIKLHKYICMIDAKINFVKSKNNYLKVAKNIKQTSFESIIKVNENLKMADLKNKLGTYSKDSYKSFFSSENMPKVNELIYIPQSDEIIFDDSLILTYKNNEKDIEKRNKLKTYDDLYKYVQDNISTFYFGQTDKDSKPHGYGEMLNINGTRMKGFWNHSVFFGWGEITDKSGNILQGKFSNNLLNDFGKSYNIMNNVLYSGQFVNGVKEGYGVEICNEGKYEGDFKDNYKSGKGKMIYNSGDVYTGNFENGIIDGDGHYIWKETGYEYIGQYKQGLMHGEGLYKWNDNEYYKGSFVNGIKEGQGEIRWANGRKFIGPFKNGKPHGIGLYENGINIKGEAEFIDGKLNKNYYLQKMKMKYDSYKGFKKENE